MKGVTFEELKVVEELRAHGLEATVGRYFLKYNRHTTLPHLVQLKYDQLNSDMSLPVVQECRGIIVDEQNDFNVVSLPFLKFFNMREHLAARIQWDSADTRVEEKVDGSLMQLYWYAGRWHAATSGLPDASGFINGFGRAVVEGQQQREQQAMTFHQLFFRTLAEGGCRLPEEPHRHIVFVFELFTKYNRVIVQGGQQGQQEDQLVLLGCRDMRTLCEVDPKPLAHLYGYRRPRTFPHINSAEAALQAASSLDPLRQEGFVVVQRGADRRHWVRVKLKSPSYVLLGLLSLSDRNNLNKRRLLRLIALNEGDEFLAYFPRFTEQYRQLHSAFQQLADRLDAVYAQAAVHQDGREFAKHVNQTDVSGHIKMLFQMKKTGADARTLMSSMNEKQLDNLFK